ncbi:hypothetical protein [Kribbella deserti]|uniref:Uncharacterized protein n=1 Tax=Kribbella deserti TaxID=1926257 RepID=A0ABV6QG91_9ACTN
MRTQNAMRKAMRSAAVAALAAGMVLIGAVPAQAMTTPSADATFGTTKCGSYHYGGSGYTYQFEKNIPISSAGWTRLLANDPYGLKVQDNIWKRISPSLGKVFPLYNFSTQQAVVGPNGDVIYTHTNLNTAMNNATCGSKFWVSGPKNLAGAAALTYGIHAGRMEVVQTRTNGISFKGIEGVMTGAVMNFRVVSGASRTFLNVHVSGPKASSDLQGWLRDFMESQASTEWQNFANNIGAAQ